MYLLSFYIIVITKKKLNTSSNYGIAGCAGTYLTGVSDRCYYKKWKILLNSNGKNMIPVKERALVFQGGGSLGAYEAGNYKALYEFLSKYDETEGKGKDQPLILSRVHR